MSNKVRFLALSLALLAAFASSAQAFAPTEVSVAGRVKPASPSCTVQAPQEIEYGLIALDKISTDGITLLGKRLMNVQIHCDRAAKYTVQLADTKQSTAARSPDFLAEVADKLPGFGADEAFGLGLDSRGQKIGALFMQVHSASVNAPPGAGAILVSARTFRLDGENWVLDGPDRLRHQRRYAFAPALSAVPASLTTATIYINMFPVIDSAQLDLTKRIDVSGEFTIEITQI